jgi:hypothetical protein
MEPSLRAILARCNGDVNAAIEYCECMAYVTPRIAVEYRGYRDALIERMVEKQLCAMSASS